MNPTRQLLLDSAQRVFDEYFSDELRLKAEKGEWLASEWSAVEEFGAPLALLSEEESGFGLSPADALSLVRLAAAACVPLPIAEAMLGNWLLAHAGLSAVQGPLTIAPVNAHDRLTLAREADGWRLTGTAHQVPWGRSGSVVALAEFDGGFFIALADSKFATVQPGFNLAGHPRDTLTFDAFLSIDKVAEAPDGFTSESLIAAGASMRATAIAGALEQVLEISVSYANERVQFARPLSKFQAVQQNAARLAGEVAAAGGAADLAAEAFGDPRAINQVAVAKIRAGEAASIGASIAHQLFGAIGFTREHRLNFLTRQLWSWRDEFGNEAAWSRRLGQAIVDAGSQSVWPLITSL